MTLELKLDRPAPNPRAPAARSNAPLPVQPSPQTIAQDWARLFSPFGNGAADAEALRPQLVELRTLLEQLRTQIETERARNEARGGVIVGAGIRLGVVKTQLAIFADAVNQISDKAADAVLMGETADCTVALLDEFAALSQAVTLTRGLVEDLCNDLAAATPPA